MPRRGKKAFTDRTLAALKKPGWHADLTMPGFGFRVLPSGIRTFVVRYTVRGTDIRRASSLGEWGTVTLAEARDRAREILSAAALGGDPLGKRLVPTWEEWSKTYFARLDRKTKESFHRRFLGLTEEMNRKATRNPAATDDTFRSIRARWGKRSLDSFTPEDVETERQALREKGEATANRWLAVTAAAFQAAVRAEIIVKNPAAKVRAGRENPARSRTLSPDEVARLLAVLPGEADQHAVAAVLLALLGGARRGEALALLWDGVNLEEGRATLADSKSGRPRHIPLVPHLVEHLRRLPRVEPFVVASGGKRPRPDIKGPWSRIVAAAKIEGATFHDLRRTFGLALNRAGGLRLAQEGLGHTTPDQTAAAYTPQNFSDIKAAAEKMASVLIFPSAKTA